MEQQGSRFVGYGSAGGVHAVEQLRLVMAELQVADVRAQVAVSIITEFEDFRIFKPASYQEKLVNNMLDQVISWGRGSEATSHSKMIRLSSPSVMRIKEKEIGGVKYNFESENRRRITETYNNNLHEEKSKRNSSSVSIESSTSSSPAKEGQDYRKCIVPQVAGPLGAFGCGVFQALAKEILSKYSHFYVYSYFALILNKQHVNIT